MIGDLISTYGLDVIGAVFAAIAAYVARAAVNHVWLAGMLGRLVVEAKAAVKEVEQVYVDKITEGRLDGSLSVSEAAAARTAAVTALKGNLGKKGLARLGRILGLTDAEIDRLLGTHLEAAVHDMSLAAVVADDKFKVTVTEALPAGPAPLPPTPTPTPAAARR